MAKQTTVEVSPEVATSVALACNVMHKSIAGLSRAQGSVWRALQEAAGAFPACMSEADKKTLSGQLAATYKAGGLENAPVIASQHARAIFLIATAAPGADGTVPDPAKFKGMNVFFAFFGKAKPAPVAPTSGSVGRADNGNAPASGAPAAAPSAAAIGPLLTQNMVSCHGLPPESVDCVQALVKAMRGDPELQDLMQFVARETVWFKATATAELRARTAAAMGGASKATARGGKPAASGAPAAPSAMAAALTAALAEAA